MSLSPIRALTATAAATATVTMVMTDEVMTLLWYSRSCYVTLYGEGVLAPGPVSAINALSPRKPQSSRAKRVFWDRGYRYLNKKSSTAQRQRQQLMHTYRNCKVL